MQIWLFNICLFIHMIIISKTIFMNNYWGMIFIPSNPFVNVRENVSCP